MGLFDGNFNPFNPFGGGQGVAGGGPFGGFPGGVGGGFGNGFQGGIFGGNPQTGGGTGGFPPWWNGTWNGGQYPNQGQPGPRRDSQWGFSPPGPGVPRQDTQWGFSPPGGAPQTSAPSPVPQQNNAFANGPGAFTPGGIPQRPQQNYARMGLMNGLPFSPGSVAPTADPNRFVMHGFVPQGPQQMPSGSGYGGLRWSGGVGTGPFGQRQQQNVGQGWQNMPLPAAPLAPQSPPNPRADWGPINFYTGKRGG